MEYLDNYRLGNLERLFKNRDTFEYACAFYKGQKPFIREEQRGWFEQVIANKESVIKNEITYSEWEATGFIFSFATRLDCSSCGLTELTAQITNLKSLTKLLLFNNKLTTLPAEIGQLQNLRYLYCEYNKLISLPFEISQLQNLENLYIHNNQLTKLPVEIGELQNLQSLRCNNNKLDNLPYEILQLHKLKILYCKNNNINSLPLDFLSEITQKNISFAY